MASWIWPSVFMLIASGAEAKEIGDSVLNFWFQQCKPWQWFRRDSSFDALVRERFGTLTNEALDGGLKQWEDSPQQCLALVLLLDQFARQLWRDHARAFSGDQRALRLSQQALNLGWIDCESEQARRQFWLMPMLHSEHRAVVSAAIPLLELHSDAATAAVARRNLNQLERFGRYPRRNAALKRQSTGAELQFLNANNKSQ